MSYEDDLTLKDIAVSIGIVLLITFLTATLGLLLWMVVE